MTNPVQIDTKLAELYFQEHRARDRHDRIQKAILDARIAKSEGRPCYMPYDEADANEAYAALRAVIEQELPLEETYEREPWNRYWHVTNVNGHIHRSMACTSCFPATQYGWRTDLSGLSEQEVVDREAYNACSVCMPIAPAEQKAARERYTREQRDAKRAEKNAAKVAKLDKSIARLEKHIVKVEKVIENIFGGHESFNNDYSLYGHDGRKSVYDATFDLPAMIGTSLYAIKRDQEERYKDSDNPYTKLTKLKAERDAL